jgi:hypothetical protein
MLFPHRVLEANSGGCGMSGGFLLMEAKLPPEPKPDVHLFIVFDNEVSVVDFDQDDDPDMYYLEDERLDDEKLWEDPNSFFDMFMDDIDVPGTQGKRIIVINYNPMVAQCVREFFKLFEGEDRIRWHALSFFHSDEETEELGLNWTDVLLEKVYVIDSLNYFPWIQKLEVEPYEILYHRDLLRLVLDEEDFKELDNEDEEPFARMDNGKPPQLTWSTIRPDQADGLS